MGDFNLDQGKNLDTDYSHKNYFVSLNEAFMPLNLIQLVNFETWSRVINNTFCSSIIDHVYTRDPTKINSIYPITPPFGDHCLIIIEMQINQKVKQDAYRRNWKKYNKENLINVLSQVNWQIECDSVQSYWNSFESKLIEVVDILAPIEIIKANAKNNATPSAHIKNKINKRNRLLKN